MPTYWPTDRNKIPDLVDVGVTKNILRKQIRAESCFELSSNHSPIILNLGTQVLIKEKLPILCNKHTNWNMFRTILDEKMPLSILLKIEGDVFKAVDSHAIQEAAWEATPELNECDKIEDCHQVIKNEILEKKKN